MNIEAGGDVLHVREYGGSKGDVVVLLHPLAMSGEIWQPMAEWQGRDGRTVLAPDLPSRADRPTLTIDDMAADVADALDRMSVGRADVLGMSMGGCVALQLALDRPDLIRRLVLADTTASYGTNRVAQWEERAHTAETSARSELIEFQLGRWFSDGFRAAEPAECDRCARIFLATDKATHAACCRALGRFDVTDRLGEIDKATLVLVGEEDYATPPAMSRALCDGIAGATYVELPNVRHYSLVANPDAWQLVDDHFAPTPVR